MLGTCVSRSTETTLGWAGLSAAGTELGAAGHIQPQTEGQDPALLPLVVILQLLVLDVPQQIKLGNPVQPATRSWEGRRASWGVRNVPCIARGLPHTQK